MRNNLALFLLGLYVPLSVQNPVQSSIPVIQRLEVEAPERVAFTSPGYENGHYPDFAEIYWELHAPSATKIEVMFEDFSVEYHPFCIWDNVTLVRSNCDHFTNAGQGDVIICGNWQTYTFSSSRTICVLFRSDHMVHRRGFKAYARAFADTENPTRSSTIANSESTSQVTPPSSTIANSDSTSQVTPPSSTIANSESTSQVTPPSSTIANSDSTSQVTPTSSPITNSASRSQVTSHSSPITNSASPSQRTSTSSPITNSASPSQGTPTSSPITTGYSTNQGTPFSNPITTSSSTSQRSSSTTATGETVASATTQLISSTTVLSGSPPSGTSTTTVPSVMPITLPQTTTIGQSSSIATKTSSPSYTFTKPNTLSSTASSSTSFSTRTTKSSIAIPSIPSQTSSSSPFYSSSSISSPSHFSTPLSSTATLSSSANQKTATATSTQTVSTTATADKFESEIVVKHDICEPLTKDLALTEAITLVTPGFTENIDYPLNKQCTVFVNNTLNSEIQMTVQQFDMETHRYCQWDHLELEYTDTTLKLCGSFNYQSESNNCKIDSLQSFDYTNHIQSCLFEKGIPVIIKSTELNLTFYSDHFLSKSGFNITLTPISIQEVSNVKTELPHSSTETYIDNMTLANTTFTSGITESATKEFASPSTLTNIQKSSILTTKALTTPITNPRSSTVTTTITSTHKSSSTTTTNSPKDFASAADTTMHYTNTTNTPKSSTTTTNTPNPSTSTTTTPKSPTPTTNTPSHSISTINTNTPLPLSSTSIPSTPKSSTTTANTPMSSSSATNTPKSSTMRTNTPVPSTSATTTPKSSTTTTNSHMPSSSATNTLKSSSTTANTPMSSTSATNTPKSSTMSTNTPVPSTSATNTPTSSTTTTNSHMPSSSATNALKSSSTTANTPMSSTSATNTPNEQKDPTTTRNMHTSSTTTTETPKHDTQSSIITSGTACSGVPEEMIGDSGYIESPGFYDNNNYPPESNCTWRITEEKDKIIMIVFERFDVEDEDDCRWDKLIFYEITNDGETKTIKETLCGHSIPETMSSTEDLQIEFISDSMQQRKGFRLRYIKTELVSGRMYTCPAGQIACVTTGRCIPVEWWCDTLADCEDGTDENNCDNCQDEEIQCGDGTCRGNSSQCDGSEQCPYGTDEHNCVYIPSGSHNEPVHVNIQGEWLPLCFDELTVFMSDDVCKAAGYRSSDVIREAAAVNIHSFSILGLESEAAKLTFATSSTCASGKTVNLKCVESGCGTKAKQVRKKRIIGGSVSSKGEWPWSVALRSGNNFICGGTIIDRMWIVTAGHCVKDLINNPQILSIIAGVNDINDALRQIRYVSEVAVHPNYDYIFNADIALLRLQRPLDFNEDVNSICLPWDKKQFSPSNLCYVTGFGVSDMKDYYTTVTPKFLRHLKTKIIGLDQCRQMYSEKPLLKDSVLCAGYISSGMDACKGDSGSGLVCQGTDGRWLLAGVVSWGDMCGSTNRPGVYTNVVSFIDWIDQKTKRNGVKTIACDFETDDWCGYTDVSDGTYIWTRKPGDKYVKGTVLYASRTSTGNHHTAANASLLTPMFSIADQGCLTFAFMFSGNSNITLSVYGIADNDAVDSPVTELLWRITSHYPAKDTWKSTEITIPPDFARLNFLSLQEHAGISGLGLDNVSMSRGPCSGSEFLECNFNAGDLCKYTQVSGSNPPVYWVVDQGQKLEYDRYIKVGGDINTFGYLGLSQFVSETLTPGFTSLPHCITFTFNKMKATQHNLVLATYLAIGDNLVNQKLFWSSEGAELNKWTTTSATITRDYYHHLVFEVRRQTYTNEVIEMLLDDIKVTDGICV